MNIAIIGYGKMGKTIEEILIERGHTVSVKLNRKPEVDDLKNVDVAIEFSNPEVAFENIRTLIENKIPTISGTTGWLEHLHEIIELNQKKDCAFLYGSNFSLGVNLFFELNERLAKLMAKYPEYKIELEEIHHTQKLDAPSGTAISLARGIIENSDKTDWKLDESISDEIIPIKALRIENVPGMHTVSYISEVDTIEITHTAHTRKGFAFGAVLAAEWIHGKSGFFSMKDVLGLD
ncbi:4-hydroxy-tetrahydrodipicolinate reductase [Moheibacter sediminis]|uniref:4-hydroxy-tetrahydrodipicolinate reductase n=1 Tax=Moheibacter sediminis TaxID=1434700 RepID=A0A1W2AJE2_9FLAO|nr:4-hydroxy-tetrahydrodipicolinate reductase [Moheibacter sediminis]SMC60734.1 dihydrodipicolinate reductase [Moheibacter sediminis]